MRNANCPPGLQDTVPPAPLAEATLGAVLAELARHPVRELVRKWNYKSAVTSSVVRALLFLTTNLTAGLSPALAAAAAEFAFRLATSGFYGALMQAFGRVRPSSVGTLAAVVCVPVVAHTLEITLHSLRGTPNLTGSIGASVVLTVCSTAFNLFAMRRGVLVVGVAGRRTLAADLAQLPRLAVELAREMGTGLRALGPRRSRAARPSRAGRVLGVGFVAVLTGAASAAPASADEGVVRRFLAHVEPPITSYRGYRRIDVYNARFKAQGWMEVATTLEPESGFTWRIVAEGGSAYIRAKVIRKALEIEAAAVRAGEPERSAVTAANYVLTPQEETGDGAAAIRLEARRRDRLLVDGLMRIDAAGDLLEVRGRLARNPSWWTTWVEVVRRYVRVANIRVPVDTELVSSVRLAGRSHLRVLYHFVELNGRPAATSPVPEWPAPAWASEASPSRR